MGSHQTINPSWERTVNSRPNTISAESWCSVSISQCSLRGRVALASKQHLSPAPHHQRWASACLCQHAPIQTCDSKWVSNVPLLSRLWWRNCAACWKYETKYTVVKHKRQQGRPPNLSIRRTGKTVTQEAMRACTQKGLPLPVAAQRFSNPCGFCPPAVYSFRILSAASPRSSLSICWLITIMLLLVFQYISKGDHYSDTNA